LKKNIFIMIAICLFFALPAFAGTLTQDVKLFAHRGLTINFPENSFEAIKAAKDFGLYGTEIDLRTTKDKKIILFHDKNLGRLTTGKGNIIDKNFSQIHLFNLKNRQGRETIYKIPLFENVLIKVKKWQGFFLALDIKNVDVNKVCELVVKYKLKNRVYFFIPGPKAVATAKKIKAFDPDLMISIDLLNWWQIMDIPEFVIKALDADAVFASEWFFPRHGFSEARQANAQVQVFLYGSHDLPARMDRAIKLGAQVISSDYPDILSRHLKSR